MSHLQFKSNDGYDMAEGHLLRIKVTNDDGGKSGEAIFQVVNVEKDRWPKVRYLAASDSACNGTLTNQEELDESPCMLSFVYTSEYRVSVRRILTPLRSTLTGGTSSHELMQKLLQIEGNIL